MDLRNLKIGLLAILVIVGIVVGFFAFNNYIYKQKRGDNTVPGLVSSEEEIEIPVFVWKYEKADSLNLDGFPETHVFLEVRYPNGKIQNKLIDTVPGSCNDLPDKDEDSAPNSTNIQCYYAGLGYVFKVIQGEDSYLVMRKTFEEGLPDYNPPSSQYEIVSKFSF